MSKCEHEKSVLKSVAIVLAFELGYTSVLHSVAAVYELGIMDAIKQMQIVPYDDRRCQQSIRQ